MSTQVTLSSREEPCRLKSHSHPGRSRVDSHSHPGRSRVDSRHTLIWGGAVSTHVTHSSREEPCRLTSTLSSREEPCRLTSHSHLGRSRVDSCHTLIRGRAVSTHVTLSSRKDPVGTAFICTCILGRDIHAHVVSFNCYSDFLFVSDLS